MNLKNKRILITAGPTWVAIDKVRVISNTATGETGFILAQELRKRGARVTLLLGPAQYRPFASVRVVRFRFFKELKDTLLKELRSVRYDAVIHCAAVSDYRPESLKPGKIKSGIRRWQLNLVPTEKLIDIIKRIDRSLFLVGFKFESDWDKNRLLQEARALARRARLDVTVANTTDNSGRYQAYIIAGNSVIGPLYTKKGMARQLVSLIGSRTG